jgi:hypothetical protein
MMFYLKQSLGVALLLACVIATTLFQFCAFPGLSLHQAPVAVRLSKVKEKLKQEDSKSLRPDPGALHQESGASTARGRCAINLFVLPRSFQSLVLPSLVQNVLSPNSLYQCDYFVHYYFLTYEEAGRSGLGGRIDPDEILLLEQAVRDVSPNSVISFRFDHEQAFWDKYQPFIDKIRTANDTDGRYLYFPWRDTSYVYPQTLDNIVKMWHSIESAWEVMTKHELETSLRYDRVAVLRSDVVYVTPIDFFQVNWRLINDSDRVAVVPAFGRYPVNDRMIVGPREAVEIWAAQRFNRLETHIKFVQENHPGWGMHSERFIKWTINPAIRDSNTTIVEDGNICFFRVRADETVKINDCEDGKSVVAAPSIVENTGEGKAKLLESILGRKCLVRPPDSASTSLQCPKNMT